MTEVKVKIKSSFSLFSCQPLNFMHFTLKQHHNNCSVRLYALFNLQNAFFLLSLNSGGAIFTVQDNIHRASCSSRSDSEVSDSAAGDGREAEGSRKP